MRRLSRRRLGRFTREAHTYDAQKERLIRYFIISGQAADIYGRQAITALKYHAALFLLSPLRQRDISPQPPAGPRRHYDTTAIMEAGCF